MAVEIGLPTDKKRPWGRILFGMALIAMIAVGASVTLTQYLAHTFHYHAGLGAPAIGAFYWPWQWIDWAGTFYGEHPLVFDRIYTLVGAGSLAIFGFAAIGVMLGRRRSKGHKTIHGSAHFASPKEIEATGLLPHKSRKGKGVYVGGWQDGRGAIRYLRHDGPEHVIAFAPTRSGKGVGLVIPTLLSWPHSVVVHDIKGENWALTAGWRKTHAGNVVLKFDPAASDGSSVKFNPLEEIRLGTDHEVADVQNIVTLIVDPDGKGLNDHWAKTGHALLVGAVLHALYKAQAKGETATLRGVADLLSDPIRPIEEVFQEMLETKHRGEQAHPVVAASARDMLNKAENERSGVLSTAMSFLTLYRDPIVASNTAHSEFRIQDLMNHEKPVSLYLVIRPSDKDRLKPLVRLIMNQIVRILTERMAFRDGRGVQHYRHRLLLLIDEFPSLGRLDVFQEALAFIAGYGLKAYLIVQDLTQLNSAYGRDEAIISNCHVRVAFAPNKIETAELLSKMSGTTTVVKRSTSTSGKRFGAVLGHVSQSFQEVQRPLLTLDECMRLPGIRKDADGQINEAGDMLIFVAGHAPIYGRQILYFQDPAFAQRAKVPAPQGSDRLRVEASGEMALEFRLA
jgi:type IV secretion system protein VirD4